MITVGIKRNWSSPLFTQFLLSAVRHYSHNCTIASSINEKIRQNWLCKSSCGAQKINSINKNKSLLHVVRCSQKIDNNKAQQQPKMLWQKTESLKAWRCQRWVTCDIATSVLLFVSFWRTVSNLLWYMAQQCCRLLMRKGHWGKNFGLKLAAAKFVNRNFQQCLNKATKKTDSLTARKLRQHNTKPINK